MAALARLGAARPRMSPAATKLRAAVTAGAVGRGPSECMRGHESRLRRSSHGRLVARSMPRKPFTSPRPPAHTSTRLRTRVRMGYDGCAWTPAGAFLPLESFIRRSLSRALPTSPRSLRSRLDRPRRTPRRTRARARTMRTLPRAAWHRPSASSRSCSRIGIIPSWSSGCTSLRTEAMNCAPESRSDHG
jgi:hypothetical protein